jgi:hypothetical protein
MVGLIFRPSTKLRRVIFFPKIAEGGIGHEPMGVLVKELVKGGVFKSLLFLQWKNLFNKRPLSRHYRYIVHISFAVELVLFFF